ncbi:hypothetical protein [Streptomyces sp. NPDC048603]|uniref:hypothetical protein n=1 Tax=Streptomyces sp. NPDC048603 TaxID=3365577 RepID=UPI00371F5A1C
MMEIINSGDIPDGEEEGEVRPGPWWRHTLWVLGVTAGAIAFAWVASSFRLGPEEYGIPRAAPGSLWPMLGVCAAVGLVAVAALRATAARIPVYGPGRVGFVLVSFGARLAVGFDPGPGVVAAGAAAVVLAAAIWCAYAAWTHRGTLSTATG